MQNKIKNFIFDRKLLILMIVFIIIITAVDKKFFSLVNIINLFSHSAIYGILAVGMTILMVSGVFDLSIGSVMALSGIISILLQPYGLAASIIGGLMTGLVVGLINGLLVTYAKIQAFMATLATMVFVRGICLSVTKGTSISSTLESFNKIYNTNFFNIPIVILYSLLIYVIGWFLLSHTKFGKYSYAIGGNVDSAMIAGINVNLYKIYYFMFCSFLASVAGIILSSKTTTGSTVLGDDVNLIVISAVVLGGTSLAGGKGTIPGTFFGVIFFGLVSRSMIYLNISNLYQLIFRGLIILIVVMLDALAFRGKKQYSI
jgi:ribose transport system permease protein